MYYSTKAFKILSGILLVLLLGNSSLSAQMKSIKVDFKIVEENYKLFYDSGIPGLETAAAQLLTQIFQNDFPFVRFGTEDAPVLLNVSIEKENTGLENPLIHKVEVNLAVINNGVTSEKMPFTFRSAEDYFAPLPDTPEAFLAELERVITFWLEQEQEAIVKDVMSNVSLAEKAHPDSENGSWVLPFSENNFFIAEDSEFIVTSRINTGSVEQKIEFQAVAKGKVLETATDYPEEYRGKIYANIKDLSPEQKQRMQSSDLNVKGIYMTKFIRAIISDPFSPDEFNLIEN